MGGAAQSLTHSAAGEPPAAQGGAGNAGRPEVSGGAAEPLMADAVTISGSGLSPLCSLA